MHALKLLKLFAFFTALGVGGIARAEGSSDFSHLFTEKVLTVTRGSDGLMPGTLRTALIQASGIRTQNAFTLVKIVFDPNIDRVRVTKGPLPEISGSLTTLDCRIPMGRVVIEGTWENPEGVDPGLEVAGLKLTSNGNSVRHCHITGFLGPGILVRGNRNTIEFNTLGYHKDIPEASMPASALYGEPKTNQGAGVMISDGASENIVQSNEIVANTYNGVEIGPGAGANNKIVYNFFAKNSGQSIKVGPNRFSTKQPQITKVARDGDFYMISGVSEADVELQIYMLGKDSGEVGTIVVPRVQIPRDNFTISTKSKGFIPGQTKIVALAHGIGRNSSEFSSPVLIPAPPGAASSEPAEAASVKPETVPAAKEEAETAEEPADIEVELLSDEESPPSSADASLPKPANLPNLPEKAPEADTVIHIQGLGESGNEPDSGSLSEKSPRFGGIGF